MSAVNLTVLLGECSGPPEIRTLSSGSTVASLGVRAPTGDGSTTSVPVTVWEPAGWIEDLDAGEVVLVVGRVRRRFFRTTTGATAARVDVEAEALTRARDRRRVGALLRRVESALEPLG